MKTYSSWTRDAYANLLTYAQYYCKNIHHGSKLWSETGREPMKFSLGNYRIVMLANTTKPTWQSVIYLFFLHRLHTQKNVTSFYSSVLTQKMFWKQELLLLTGSQTFFGVEVNIALLPGQNKHWNNVTFWRGQKIKSTNFVDWEHVLHSGVNCRYFRIYVIEWPTLAIWLTHPITHIFTPSWLVTSIWCLEIHVYKLFINI